MAPETMKLNVSVSSNGDVDVGEISLADMDPEDIRVNVLDINKSNANVAKYAQRVNLRGK